MRYLLLIYQEEAAHAQLSQEQLGAEYEAYNAFGTEVQKREVFLSGEALMPISTATTVRVRNGKTLTVDGPFAETKEQLGGFYLIEGKALPTGANATADAIRFQQSLTFTEGTSNRPD